MSEILRFTQNDKTDLVKNPDRNLDPGLKCYPADAV